MYGPSANKPFREFCVAYLSDLNNVPKSLYKELHDCRYILRNIDGSFIWKRGKPDYLPYRELTALYRRCCLYGLPPVGLHAPENLGKIDPKGDSGHE
jgi:hypothetical protein